MYIVIRKDSMKHGQKKKKNHPTYLFSLAFAKLKVIHKTYLFTILVQSVLFLSPNLVNNS